jgi:hypothetical protein
MISLTKIRPYAGSHTPTAILVVLTSAACHLLATTAAAAPSVLGSGHFTVRFGPNNLPEGVVGDKVVVFAGLDSSDPIGSPTISVEAVQGGTTLTLDPTPPIHPLWEEYYLYDKVIDFDAGLTGAWQIIPTDSTGTGPAIFTNAIAQPEFLPLVEDITVGGTTFGDSVSWTLPNLDGFDVNLVAVRAAEAVSGTQLWQSATYPVHSTSIIQIDTSRLQVGVEYVYAVLLGDLIDPNGFELENASWGFSEPFRFGLPGGVLAGDYNNNGLVEQHDLDLVLSHWGEELLDPAAAGWLRDLPGGTVDQSELDKVLAHWGSMATIASTAAVPEPSTFVLAAAGFGFLTCLRRSSRRPDRFS